jgi:hypothetical protein
MRELLRRYLKFACWGGAVAAVEDEVVSTLRTNVTASVTVSSVVYADMIAATFLDSTCRSTIFGPGLIQFDFNVTRSFNYFGEGRRLELRWDMLNMFNNTHFGLPSQDVSSGTFGQISSLAGDPRVMQFALKFYF